MIDLIKEPYYDRMLSIFIGCILILFINQLFENPVTITYNKS